MKNEEWIKKSEEIMDNSYSWHGLEDEVLKLYCLFSKCSCDQTENDTEFLRRNYVISKLMRVLSKQPTILDGASRRVYASLKIEMMNQKPTQEPCGCFYCKLSEFKERISVMSCDLHEADYRFFKDLIDYGEKTYLNCSKDSDVKG